MSVKTATHAKQGTPKQIDRAAFWLYCKRATTAAHHRSRLRSMPCDLDPHLLDRMLVDQGWRCAVSGILLVPSGSTRDPFGPSLDRIVPALGYVEGNVRIVCNMVNLAMNEWGADNLWKLVRAMSARRHEGNNHPP